MGRRIVDHPALQVGNTADNFGDERRDRGK